ncbi:MAG TPA: hypothetical protein VF832_00945, partial [Longimicrobiales bacterium]
MRVTCYTVAVAAAALLWATPAALRAAPGADGAGSGASWAAGGASGRLWHDGAEVSLRAVKDAPIPSFSRQTKLPCTAC